MSSAERGKHVQPRSGRLPSLALPTSRGRHGQAGHGPTSTVLLAATVGGVILTTGLPGPGSAVSAYAASAIRSEAPAGRPAPAAEVPGAAGAPSAANVSSAAGAPSAASPAPSPAAALSRATQETRELLADRASRSRRLPVVASPFVAPPVSVPRPVAAPVLPGCVGAPSTDGANGRLPDRVLCDVGSGERLRADAARAFAALAVAYRSRFGTEPCLIDGYRTLGEQQVLRRTKRRFAAPAGTSEHGWGLAIDLGCEVRSRDSAQHRWMQDNGPSFGWVNPPWAQRGGSRPEPWHWEFGTGA